MIPDRLGIRGMSDILYKGGLCDCRSLVEDRVQPDLSVDPMVADLAGQQALSRPQPPKAGAVSPPLQSLMIGQKSGHRISRLSEIGGAIFVAEPLSGRSTVAWRTGSYRGHMVIRLILDRIRFISVITCFLPAPRLDTNWTLEQILMADLDKKPRLKKPVAKKPYWAEIAIEKHKIVN